MLGCTRVLRAWCCVGPVGHASLVGEVPYFHPALTIKYDGGYLPARVPATGSGVGIAPSLEVKFKYRALPPKPRIT